jgi:hypothetical protein
MSAFNAATSSSASPDAIAGREGNLIPTWSAVAQRFLWCAEEHPNLTWNAEIQLNA